MMNKTAIALTLTSLLTLPLVVSSDAWAAPVRSLQRSRITSSSSASARWWISCWQTPPASSTPRPGLRCGLYRQDAEQHGAGDYPAAGGPPARALSHRSAHLGGQRPDLQRQRGQGHRPVRAGPHRRPPDDLDINTYLATWQRFKATRPNPMATSSGSASSMPVAPPTCSDCSPPWTGWSPPLKERQGRGEKKGAAPSSPWAMPSIPMAPCTTSCWDASRPPAPWPRPIRRPSSSSPAACPRTARPRAS